MARREGSAHRRSSGRGLVFASETGQRAHRPRHVVHLCKGAGSYQRAAAFPVELAQRIVEQRYGYRREDGKKQHLAIAKALKLRYRYR